MNFSQKLFCFSILVGFGLMSCTNTFAETSQQDYNAWLNQLKKEMHEKGISQKTLNTVYAKNYYPSTQKIVKIDRKQNEFVLTTSDYINKVVNPRRVKIAQEKYKEYYPKLKKISKQYGVQPQYIIAFWGVETNFGQNFGGYNVFEALTVLSYDNRRPKFFRQELYNALLIADKQNINIEKMESSWAGAMGNFQFMPSTYNRYAVDFNQDGKIDIWEDFDDAAASAANYLSNLGWDKNTEWGEEVVVPWNFDFSQTGYKKIKKISEWKKLGIKTANQKNLQYADDLSACLIVPEGKKGKIYLVLNNFNNIMQWNRSENYALSIGILADYVRTGQKHQIQMTSIPNKLETKDIILLQKFINEHNYSKQKLSEDGILGSQTKEAIKNIQRKAHLVPDRYPDTVLLNLIKEYNSTLGFKIPVPDKKLSKKK